MFVMNIYNYFNLSNSDWLSLPVILVVLWYGLFTSYTYIHTSSNNTTVDNEPVGAPYVIPEHGVLGVVALRQAVMHVMHLHTIHIYIYKSHVCQ